MITHLTPCRSIKGVYTDGTHTFFWNGVFSSWHPSPLYIDNFHYNCCEQYFMFKKAALFDDEAVAKMIWASTDPREIKALGRKVSSFVPEVWDRVSRDFMFRAHWAKFTQNNRLYELLLEMGDTKMVEASPYDTIWGIGMGVEDNAIVNPTNWKGKNQLGEILTEIKDAFRE